MNYSSAVKGRLTRSSTIGYILSQAELELTRPLNKEEEAKLFERFAVQDIFNRIHKVGLILLYFHHTLLLVVWLWHHQVPNAFVRQA